MKSYIMVLLIWLLGLAGAALAQTDSDTNKSLDQLFGEHKPYADFFAGLQKAIGSNDREAVAAMVDYPFQARIGGKALKIRDADHFVADYDKVITPRLKDAVARQSYGTLFANWQGVMIGDGELWFSGVGETNEIKITAIND